MSSRAPLYDQSAVRALEYLACDSSKGHNPIQVAIMSADDADAGESQFAGSDMLVEQADCKVFIGDRELGTGTIRVTER